MNGMTLRVAGVAIAGAALFSGAANPLSSGAASAALAADDSARCSALPGSTVGGAKIESAKYVAPGTKLPILNIPAATGICQVRASISPVPTSKIRVEIWLPSEWNGKMLGLGGAGFSGGMAMAPLTFPKPVRSGFITMATDAGHEVTEPPEWAFKQPERIVDYGYRANHLGTLVAKALAGRYYGVAAKRAYFQGCSNGGRDALMLAQRFPKDYDGIVAGAPANNFVSLMANFARTRSLIEKLPPDSLTPKMKLLHEAALAKCDALDGARDGMVANPNACRFDPAVLSCKAGQDPKVCLSPQEVTTVRAIYQGSRARDGRLIHSGIKVGSEYLWPEWVTSSKSTGGAFSPYFYGYFVHDNKSWAMASFDLDSDWALSRRKLSGMLDATDTDLRPFISGGGKLLMYHGWDDQAISADNSIAYFTAAKRKLGAAAGNAKLFMVPGMGHCFDGKGLTSADFVGEIDRWVESGKAPERIVAERPLNPLIAMAGIPAKPLMTRPICAWPKVARYDGKGSLDEESSFTCR